MATEEFFVTWSEFPTYGVPKYSRRYTNQMVDAGTFPPPVRLSANRIAWRLSDLERWKATRPTANGAPPILWPVQRPHQGRGGPVTDFTKPRGRPAGSRVINGKLVRPADLDAA